MFKFSNLYRTDKTSHLDDVYIKKAIPITTTITPTIATTGTPFDFEDVEKSKKVLLVKQAIVSYRLPLVLDEIPCRARSCDADNSSSLAVPPL